MLYNGIILPHIELLFGNMGKIFIYTVNKHLFVSKIVGSKLRCCCFCQKAEETYEHLSLREKIMNALGGLWHYV